MGKEHSHSDQKKPKKEKKDKKIKKDKKHKHKSKSTKEIFEENPRFSFGEGDEESK